MSTILYYYVKSAHRANFQSTNDQIEILGNNTECVLAFWVFSGEIETLIIGQRKLNRCCRHLSKFVIRLKRPSKF